jgi:hypothetical protein
MEEALVDLPLKETLSGGRSGYQLWNKCFARRPRVLTAERE